MEQLIRRDEENTGVGESTAVLWVATFPHFSTALFLVTPPELPSNARGRMQIYDPDGALINEVELELLPGQVVTLELDQFLGSCKIESGMRHAQLHLSLPPGVEHQCRLQSGGGAALLGDPVTLTGTASTFFPIVLEPGRTSYLCFQNRGESSAVVKVRLALGRRSPEAFLALPPRSSRLIAVEAEFAEYTDEAEGPQQGYLRLSSKGDGAIGVQLLERLVAGTGAEGREFFGAVS